MRTAYPDPGARMVGPVDAVMVRSLRVDVTEPGCRVPGCRMTHRWPATIHGELHAMA